VLEVGPQAWVLAPEAAPGVALAAAALLRGLAGSPFAGALERALEALRLRIVRSVTPSAAAVATSVLLRASIAAAAAAARRRWPPPRRWPPRPWQLPGNLPDARVPLLATLVVPPARKPRRDRATARLS
jgi:hypothetical protein